MVVLANWCARLPLLFYSVQQLSRYFRKEKTLEQCFAEIGVLDDVKCLLEDVDARAYREKWLLLVLEYAEGLDYNWQI